MEGQKQSGHSGMLVSFFNRVKYFLLVYFYAVTIDYGVRQNENTPYYDLLLFLFMLLSFWGEQKIRYLFPFLCYQAMLVGGCTLVGRNTQERVVFFLVSILQFGVSFEAVLAEKKRVIVNGTSALILLGIPGILYAYVKKYTLLYEVFLWVTVLFLWLHMWNVHLANRHRFLVNYAQNADSMEKKKMIADGNGVIESILAVTAGCLFLGTQIGEGRLIERFLHLLYKGLQWFFEWFTHAEVEEYSSEVVEMPIPTADVIVEDNVIKQNEMLSKIMELLGMLFWVLLKVLSVLVVFSLLAFFGYIIWKNFYKQQPDVKAEYEEVEKIREKTFVKEKKQKIFIFGNTNERVRKIFKRKIDKTEKERHISKRTKTSTELVDVVLEDSKDAVKKMLPLYQKARYSKAKISKEELENYRKM